MFFTCCVRVRAWGLSGTGDPVSCQASQCKVEPTESGFMRGLQLFCLQSWACPSGSVPGCAGTDGHVRCVWRNQVRAMLSVLLIEAGPLRCLSLVHLFVPLWQLCTWWFQKASCKEAGLAQSATTCCHLLALHDDPVWLCCEASKCQADGRGIFYCEGR